MSTARKDKREAQRQAVKDYDIVAKAIRERLEDYPQDQFKEALQLALETLDLNDHPNNLLAALLILGCLDNVEADQADIGRIMLYVSGVIVNEQLAKIALAKLFS